MIFYLLVININKICNFVILPEIMERWISQSYSSARLIPEEQDGAKT